MSVVIIAFIFIGLSNALRSQVGLGETSRTIPTMYERKTQSPLIYITPRNTAAFVEAGVDPEMIKNGLHLSQPLRPAAAYINVVSSAGNQGFASSIGDDSEKYYNLFLREADSVRQMLK